MTYPYFSGFEDIRNHAHYLMRTQSEVVHPKRWQSTDVSDKPEMATHEVLNFYAACNIRTNNLRMLQIDCQPNLPWAEDHFHERVCGEPLNPGNTWQSWPYSNKADTFRNEHGQFNHSYMERYWPKHAGMSDKGELRDTRFDPGYFLDGEPQVAPHRGIRHRYGDLQDVVNLFVRDPLTRQAFLPIFFPEDTGVHHGGRVPCTLGYHFIIRNHELHVVYFMRSCDLMRHFNDDCYLTARLAIWLLDQLRAAAPDVFSEVLVGTFTMHATSLHIFRNDWFKLYGDTPVPGATPRKVEHLGAVNAPAPRNEVRRTSAHPGSGGGVSGGKVSGGGSSGGGASKVQFVYGGGGSASSDGTVPSDGGGGGGVSVQPSGESRGHYQHLQPERPLLGGGVPNFPGARKR